MQTTQNREKPLISFIVTYYNEPVSMLRECLDSIMALPMDDNEREIILVDDGSYDMPLSDIVDFRDQLTYLRQPNAGVSVARNMGITIASGTYIQFVDSDDYLLTNGYRHCLEVLRRQSPDIITFRSTSEEKDADTPNLFNGPMSGTEYMHHHNIRAAVWGYVFRKQTLVDLRFTAGIKYGEDEEFTPQLFLRAEKVFATDCCAYLYRKNMQSVTHNNNRRALAKRLNDAEHVIFYLDHLAHTLPSAERIALQRRVAQLTMDYIYNIIVLTRSEHQLNKRLEKLSRHGMFPLPHRNYTVKYDIFRRMTTTKIGRQILMRTVPLMKR